LEGVEMGAGPQRLIADPATFDELRAQGWDVGTVTIEAPDADAPEIVRIAEADRRLARSVRSAADGGAFPLVLAGNCNSCLGTVAGLNAGAGPIGVVWFDAHADLDTLDEDGRMARTASRVIATVARAALRRNPTGSLPG
jgi:arginase